MASQWSLIFHHFISLAKLISIFCIWAILFIFILCMKSWNMADIWETSVLTSPFNTTNYHLLLKNFLKSSINQSFICFTHNLSHGTTSETPCTWRNSSFSVWFLLQNLSYDTVVHPAFHSRRQTYSSLLWPESCRSTFGEMIVGTMFSFNFHYWYSTWVIDLWLLLGKWAR